MTSDVEVINALTEAKDLIGDPERWTQGGLARAADDVFVYATDSHAVCWCAYGAVVKVAHGTWTCDRALDALSKAIESITNHPKNEWFPSSIGDFNDQHTHDEVLFAFDRAITILEEAS